MKSNLRYLILPVMVIALAFFAGCDDDETTPTTDTGPDIVADMADEEVAEATYIMVSFAIDDTENMTYTAADGLAWKGSFAYDSATNILAFDGSWGGPGPLLFDDGPISGGGHEPEGATAADNIWSVGVQVAVTAEDQNFEYGAIQGYTADAPFTGTDSWIWSCALSPSDCENNGTFTVPANATDDVVAPGMKFLPFGFIDFRLEFNASNCGSSADCELDSAFVPFATGTRVGVKGAFNNWNEVDLTDDGTAGDTTASDGVYTYVHSQNLGIHDGLMYPGDWVSFVFVIGDASAEYKGAVTDVGASVPLEDGVTAFSNAGTAATATNDDCLNAAAGCVEETIVRTDDEWKNTAIVIPGGE